MEDSLGVGKEPVDWALYILVKAEADLVNDDADGFLHCKNLRHIALSFTDPDLEFFIAQVFSKAHMEDVPCEDLSKLGRHINLMGAIRVNRFRPPLKVVLCFVFERLIHEDEAVFVEGVAASLALALPCLVVVRENERLADDVLEHDQTLTIFVMHRVFANEDVLDQLWVRDEEMDHSLEINGQDWELFAVKLLVGRLAALLQEISVNDPLLRIADGILPHVGFLVIDHVPSVPQEEAAAAWMEGSALSLVKVKPEHSSKVQKHYQKQVGQGAARENLNGQPT